MKTVVVPSLFLLLRWSWYSCPCCHCYCCHHPACCPASLSIAVVDVIIMIAGGGALWWGSVIKKGEGWDAGAYLTYHTTLRSRRCCPPLAIALPSPFSPIVVIVVVMVVVTDGYWVAGGGRGYIVVVVGHGGGCGLVEWTKHGKQFGDTSCHVINVGTCCPNLLDNTWAGGSVVKCTLLWLPEVGCLNPQNKNMFFCTKLY